MFTKCSIPGLSFVTSATSWLPTRVLLAYGRAPLAFYIAHFYLITSTSVVLVAAFGLEGVPLPFVVIIFVDASAYFLSRGVWLQIETEPTPPPAICAMRSHSLLTLNVKGSYDNTCSQIVLLNPW